MQGDGEFADDDDAGYAAAAAGDDDDDHDDDDDDDDDYDTCTRPPLWQWSNGGLTHIPQLHLCQDCIMMILMRMRMIMMILQLELIGI